MNCFNIDVRIYSTCASSSHFVFVFFLGSFVILILMYAFTCTFLVVKRILMLIMYSAASL